MTIKEFDGLCVLLKHSEIDQSYGEGGSFNNDDEFDSKEAEKAKLGIRYVERLLAKKQHQIAAKKINKVFDKGIEVNY